MTTEGHEIPKMKLVLAMTQQRYLYWCSKQGLNSRDTTRVRRVTESRQLFGYAGDHVEVIRLANWQVSVSRGDHAAIELIEAS